MQNTELNKIANAAYLHGREDYDNHGENTPNPYAARTIQWRCWYKGFNDGRSAQALDEQNSWFG